MAEVRRGESTAEPKDDAGKINGLQIAAASGSASTAALVAHALGIYGTVVGVALFSVVSSVGTVVYLKSIHRTRDQLRKVAKQVNIAKTSKSAPPANIDATTVITRQEPPDPDATTVIARQHRPDPRDTHIFARRESDSTYPPHSHEPNRDTAELGSVPSAVRRGWTRYWKPVAATSAAAFVLSLAILSGVAWISGQPPAHYYNGSSDEDVPAPQPTPLDDEDTFDEEAPSPSSPDAPEDPHPSSGPQEPSTDSEDSTEQQPPEPPTQPQDPGTSDDAPPEPPRDDEDAPEE